ncbi:ABC transporter substrate-binding protein [Pelagibius sp. Alg239-R121]|uniref:ABC transporter substrate-binding protein n=1 Tax=Pelagibius sp. Alg239-R121 TaxID=2993448 RepID=UPI0024A64370|nr:ABC transporter substrate-binding protein [Pelagibius sp. Alg239-R121]
MTKLSLTLLFAAATFVAGPLTVNANTPIIVGMDADMSSGASVSGEAIKRGAQIAIDEINARGGVLGSQLELRVLDHRGNPARGKDNIEELGETEGVVAVVGGIHTPVALAELDIIHQNELIYLGAWAAGTPVVDNGRDPNYVFRVSVRDQFAGEFLLLAAVDRGHASPCLLLEETGWGRSSERAFKTAAKKHATGIVDIQWFKWGVSNLSEHLRLFKERGCDVVMLVANPREGAVAIRSMLSLDKSQRLPIVSHWGITGGDFSAAVGQDFSEIDLVFLQTYSFINPTHPERAAQVIESYLTRHDDVSTVEEIAAPVGTAHAYDLIHLLAMALETAGTTDRAKVREALENLPEYNGLIRDYAPAFTPERHDALDASDFSLARFAPNGAIVPAE